MPEELVPAVRRGRLRVRGGYVRSGALAATRGAALHGGVLHGRLPCLRRCSLPNRRRGRSVTRSACRRRLLLTRLYRCLGRVADATVTRPSSNDQTSPTLAGGRLRENGAHDDCAFGASCPDTAISVGARFEAARDRAQASACDRARRLGCDEAAGAAGAVEPQLELAGNRVHRERIEVANLVTS